MRKKAPSSKWSKLGRCVRTASEAVGCLRAETRRCAGAHSFQTPRRTAALLLKEKSFNFPYVTGRNIVTVPAKWTDPFEKRTLNFLKVKRVGLFANNMLWEANLLEESEAVSFCLFVFFLLHDSSLNKEYLNSIWCEFKLWNRAGHT